MMVVVVPGADWTGVVSSCEQAERDHRVDRMRIVKERAGCMIVLSRIVVEARW